MAKYIPEGICKAMLHNKALPFFILALAVFFTVSCVWAGSEMVVNCAIPSVAGLNAPIVEEEEGRMAKEASIAADSAEENMQLSEAEPELTKTFYSR